MSEDWTKKDKRQFTHILKTSQEKGKNDNAAKEISARTVSKQRRKEGRTQNKTTSGTGNPNTSLDERTYRESYNRARQLNVSGRSKLKKKILPKKSENEIRALPPLINSFYLVAKGSI